MAIELQNRVSLTIELSKPFTFGHPGGFGCGFADVAATCRWDPPVFFYLSYFSLSSPLSPISLSGACGADGEARARPGAAPHAVLAARQAVGPRRPLPCSLGRWPARRGRGGRREQAARPQPSAAFHAGSVAAAAALLLPRRPSSSRKRTSRRRVAMARSSSAPDPAAMAPAPCGRATRRAGGRPSLP